MRWKTLVLLAAALAYGSAAAPAAPAAKYTVHIKDFAFKPPALHIHVGESVTFVNDDQEAHTATATDKSFDSNGLDTGDTWSHTFTKAGKYTYFCALHPYMKAVIIVSKAGGKS